MMFGNDLVEPLRMNCILKRCIILPVLLVVTSAGASVRNQQTTDNTLIQALRLSREGYPAAAMHNIRAVMQNSIPGDPAGYASLGVILLQCGRFNKAHQAFSYCLKTDPQFMPAVLGQAICEMAFDNTKSALELLSQINTSQSQQPSVQAVSACISWDAHKYNLPTLSPTSSIVMTMDALLDQKENKADLADSLFKQALQKMSGADYIEGHHLLYTFQSDNPFAGGDRVPGSEASVPMDTAGHALSGTVVLSLHDNIKDAACAAFDIDGQSEEITSEKPFECVWNSKEVQNGLHQLKVQFYSSSGLLLYSRIKNIRVMNPSRDASSQLMNQLYDNMQPYPDKAVICEALAQDSRRAGNTKDALGWMLDTAALNPSSRNHAELENYGGIDAAYPAMWGGTKAKKEVALTFDDGPVPGVTGPLLRTLQRLGVKGTFFVIGWHVAAHPKLTREIIADGMEICNHTYTHPNLARLKDKAIEKEILQNQAVIYQTTGKLAQFLRPPGGDWNLRTENIVRHWGLTPCMWTVDAYPAEVVGTMDAVRTVLDQVRPGAIILMHNGKLATIQALPSIVNALKQRGYSFVTVKQLMSTLHQLGDGIKQPKNFSYTEH